MLTGLDRLDDAHRALERARQTFEDLGQRRWLASSQLALAEMSRWEGRLLEAEGLFRSVHRFFLDQGDANNALLVAAPLADLLCDLGRSEEADMLAGQMERDASPDDLETQVAWRLVRARSRVAAGDPTGAVPLAEEATTVADSTDFVLLQADARRHLADALAGAGRIDDAARTLEAAVERYDAKSAHKPAERARDRLTTLRR
jgi:tetratricopeptide (TPR) repeat protein